MENPMSFQQIPPTKPGLFTALSIFTLISGILNIISALSLTFAVVIGTFGLGLLCAPLTIAPGILGIFEILYSMKLLANPPRPTQPSQVLAILEICCILFGGVPQAAAGIVALVAYNDPGIQQYFASLNSPAY
jgi:hypothetical protein